MTSIHFAEPLAFWAFLPVAVLTVMMLRNRRAPGFTRHFLVTLTALSLCVVGLTRPQLGHVATQTQGARFQLFLAIDVSKSMLAQDVTPSRMDFAITFSQKLLQQLSGVKVALFPFALDGYMQVPLTNDLPAAADMIASLNPNVTTNQGTDLSRSLETLYRYIARLEHAAKANGSEWFPTQVVLLSDGESHYPIRDDVTALFAKQKIPIYTVGVGTSQGATIPTERRFGGRESLRDGSGQMVRTQLHPEMLQRISGRSGGDHFTAQFDEVIKLGKRLMQAAQLGKLSTSFKADKEFFPLCFLVAFLLLSFEFAAGRWEYAIRGLLLFCILAGTARAELPESETMPDSGGARSESAFPSPVVSAPAADVDPETETTDDELRAANSYNRGLKFLKQNNFAKAAEFFQESALLTQDKVLKKKALYDLGNTFLKQMDPAQALDSYQQAHDVDSDDQKFEKDANRRISDQMVLAYQLMEQLKKQQSQQGQGKGNSDGDNDKAGGAPQDQKGPQKYNAQNFDDAQKQRIFDLVAAEEQESLQRIQEQRNQGRGGKQSEKPW